jgi:glutamine amidotransferase
MIGIVDYGLGNVRALANVYKNANLPLMICSTAEDLARPTRIVLPGVGAFDHAIELLNQSGMRQALDQRVLRDKTPVLGICVGMQIMAHQSEEGQAAGLGWIDGVVKKIDCSKLKRRPGLPHMGWNDVTPRKPTALFKELEAGAVFYFLHSYYFLCFHESDVIAETDYGGTFASAVNSANVFGIQFHPEKSHRYGTRLLKNFAQLPASSRLAEGPAAAGS